MFLCTFAGKSLIFFTNSFAGGGSHRFNYFHTELAAGADLFVVNAVHGLVAAFLQEMVCFFYKRICSFLTELTEGKAKVVRPEQIRVAMGKIISVRV